MQHAVAGHAGNDPVFAAHLSISRAPTFQARFLSGKVSSSALGSQKCRLKARSREATRPGWSQSKVFSLRRFLANVSNRRSMMMHCSTKAEDAGSHWAAAEPCKGGAGVTYRLVLVFASGLGPLWLAFGASETILNLACAEFCSMPWVWMSLTAGPLLFSCQGASASNKPLARLPQATGRASFFFGAQKPRARKKNSQEERQASMHLALKSKDVQLEGPLHRLAA